MIQRIYTIAFRNDDTNQTEHYSMTNPVVWLRQNIKDYPKGISNMTIMPATDDNLYLPF